LKNTRAFIGDCVAFDASVPTEYQDLLFDPQTSGGLLISIAPDSADAAISALDRHHVSARRIGRVLAKTNPLLFVH
jgi:selenide,water dikinase